MKYFLLIFAFLIFYYIKKIHLNIDFKSFFRKGFKKIDSAYGLYCYTGKQGTGKTYSSIRFLIKQKQRFDYRIVTNVKSFQVFPDTIYMTDIKEIINFCSTFNNNDANIIIFFDEIFTILEKKTALNKEILAFLSQLRKRNIIFITTAQEWLEINVTFRRYVRFQIDCNMISFPFTNSAICLNFINDGYALKWDNLQNEYVAPRLSTNISKGSKAIIESYDTFETIAT